MKPYIQVLWKDGRKELMHDDHDYDNICDFVVYFNDEDFSVRVQIFDGNRHSCEFDFDIDETVEVCGRCFGRSLKEFIKTTISCDIGALLDDLEVHNGEDESMGNLISEIDDELFKENSYYLRLTQQPDDEWVLSLIFWGGEAVSSPPKKWPGFNPTWKE